MRAAPPALFYLRRIINSMRAPLLLAALAAASVTYAQSELIGPGRFPETREMSGLPGGSFGVLPNGTPSFRGAMALSTPIGYSLDRWHWAAGINAVSPSMRFRGLDFEASGSTSSGTGELMTGVPTPWGALTLSAMFISVHLDETTFNAQFTPRQSGPITWAAGVQDIFVTSHTFRPREHRSSRSPYIVGTANPVPGGYVSLGYGNQRFGGIFGNVSQTFGDWKALAEYDTYSWNYGVARRLGNLGHDVEATAFVGYIRGKYATWSLTFTF